MQVEHISDYEANVIREAIKKINEKYKPELRVKFLYKTSDYWFVFAEMYQTMRHQDYIYNPETKKLLQGNFITSRFKVKQQNKEPKK